MWTALRVRSLREPAHIAHNPWTAACAYGAAPDHTAQKPDDELDLDLLLVSPGHGYNCHPCLVPDTVGQGQGQGQGQGSRR